MTLRKKQASIREYSSIHRTTCCNCPAGCGIKVFLNDKTIVDIYGDEEHPVNKGAFCPKGLLSYFHLKNPKRIVTPQIRKTLNDPFKSVSWDQAIAFAARKIQDLTEQKGKDGLFIHGHECAPFAYSAGASLFARAFGTVNNPESFLPRPFGNEGAIRKMFGVSGAQLLMNTPRDWCHSRCILLYECDLAASDPVTFGPIIDARDRGATLLTIGSRRTITSSKATFTLRVKPGSQSTILKGIIHLLIEKGFVDQDFLKESTTGYDGFKTKMKSFSPHTVAKSCWVKDEDLERMAELIGKAKPLQVIAGDWSTRSHLSDEDLCACGALLCLRGSVGIPGGGLNLLSVSPFSFEVGSPEESRCSHDRNGAVPNRFLENILMDAPDSIGALIWHGNQSAKMAVDKETKTRLEEIPLIVHLSSYPNETYHYSHVSFPMSSWLEYSGLVSINNGRAIQWHNRIIDPPGECKSPLAFWFDLAHACNMAEHFSWTTKTGNLDERSAGDHFLQENPLTRSATVDKLDPDKNPPGGLLWPCTEEGDLEFEESRFLIGRQGNVRGKNILFERHTQFPLTEKRFPTPSGKIRLLALNGAECPNSKTSVEHQTALPDISLSDGDTRFPLVLTTGVLVDFVEEFGYFVSDRDTWTANMMVQINPRTAKVLGIENRNMMIIENERGIISAPAWLHDGLDPRVIWLPKGLDPFQPHFGYESPFSLFHTPDTCSEKKGFTMVTAYKEGQDKVKNLQQLLNFLRKL